MDQRELELTLNIRGPLLIQFLKFGVYNFQWLRIVKFMKKAIFRGSHKFYIHIVPIKQVIYHERTMGFGQQKPSRLKARNKWRYVNSTTRFATAEPDLSRQLPLC
jgi:hypothetical protein